MFKTSTPLQHKNLTLFTQAIYVKDLQSLRNKYALRLQKGIAEHIIKHKHARSIYLYLELKPLFSSGVIFSDHGKIPYNKIAEFTGEGISTIRKKITILKRLKLLTIDSKKNICLSTLNRLPKLLKLTNDETRYKKKYKLLNNSETQFTVKQIAIYENLKRQEHKLFQRIYAKELLEHFYLSQLDNKNSNGFKPKNITTCEQCYSKGFIKMFRKKVRDNFESLKQKYKKVYDKQMLQLQFGFPGINPTVTLSYTGLAKVLNLKSKSTAHYQVLKLAERGMLDVTANYQTIAERSPAVFENMCGVRTDVFSYVYPTRKTLNGKIRLYFRNLPNTVKPLTNATFF